MISKQIWKPDTCRCIVEETHDPQDPNYGVKFSRVISKCEHHQSIPDNELFGVIYENPDGENRRKNKLYRILLGHEDIKDLDLSEAKKNDDGSDAGIGLKSGIAYEWAFTGTGKDRVLVASVKGKDLSQAQKKAVRDLCDHKFGKNKVTLL